VDEFVNLTENGGKMAKGAIDRRVARTRKTLHHALISLILRKDYEAITIEEICDAADVGRSTFYAHYTSKDDLHRSGIEHLRRALVDRQKESQSGPGRLERRGLIFSRTLFEHAHAHKDLFRALAGSRGGAIALASISKIIADVVRDELAALPAPNSADAVPREFATQYLVGACMAVLTWWLDKGAKLAPQRVDAMFQRLATEGIMPRR
jgi:AcrR family transcriptional regulator